MPHPSRIGHQRTYKTVNSRRHRRISLTSGTLTDQIQVLIDRTARVRIHFDVAQVVLNDTEETDELFLRDNGLGVTIRRLEHSLSR